MLRLKKGDNVKVISGKDRGKNGKIIQSFPDARRVVVEGVNLTKKHVRVRKQGEKGQVLEFAGPIAIENVMIICPKCSKAARIGMKVLEVAAGPSRKVRVCKNCTEIIE